ncbi:hypothetical protein B0H14DRAFT_2820999 [Mycena olivaceomarginata]|nr:hypothetical protein B0H14DRAFT_2820999 [Mycena olivaceomarginata]
MRSLTAFFSALVSVSSLITTGPSLSLPVVLVRSSASSENSDPVAMSAVVSDVPSNASNPRRTGSINSSELGEWCRTERRVDGACATARPRCGPRRRPAWGVCAPCSRRVTRCVSSPTQFTRLRFSSSTASIFPSSVKRSWSVLRPDWARCGG